MDMWIVEDQNLENLLIPSFKVGGYQTPYGLKMNGVVEVLNKIIKKIL